MAALPHFRTESGKPPFYYCGVDYFGPIEVTLFRRRVKRWGCLFTCMVTRAVHLEMAYGLSTDSFLTALANFENRRGVPNTYYSDNGTNFVGADRELKEWFQALNQATIAARLCRNETSWKFNPPSAPHFGGSWERLVQSAKRSLVRVLSGQSLTDETLNAAFIQVENLLNGRPLTFVGVDAKDPEVLTPNHLLLGRNLLNTAPFIPHDSDVNSRRQYKRLQAVTEQFWRRWMREYLPTSHQRSK
jgi:hypothetical protein